MSVISAYWILYPEDPNTHTKITSKSTVWDLHGKIVTISGSVFSYKLWYIVDFWLVEMGISTNQKPTIYHNLYKFTSLGIFSIYHNYVTQLG